jgi:hypothetical protein
VPITTITLHAHALGTVEDVTQYLKLASIPVQDEAEIFKTIINAATERVEDYCMRPFLTRSLNEFFDGTGQRRLYLRAHPVISVSQIDALNFEGDSFRTYTSSDIRLDTVHGIVMLKNGASFGEGLQNWQVQYIAGWATIVDVPEAVRLAFYKLCAEYWRDYEHSKDDIESQTMDGQTTFFSKALMPPRIKSLLKPHQIPAGMGGL